MIDRPEIMRRLHNGESFRSIALATGTTDTTVAAVARGIGITALHRSLDWPADKVTALIELWPTGLSTAKIGAKLNVSKNSVCAKAGRLGLPMRGSPVGVARKAAAPVKSIRRAPAVTLAPFSAETVTMPPTIFSEWGGNHREIAFTNGNRSPVRGLTLTSIQEAVAETPLRVSHTRPLSACCWPSWNHRERPTHQYCDAPSALRLDGKRSSYCEAHLKKSRANGVSHAAREAPPTNATPAPGRLFVASGVDFNSHQQRNHQ